MGIILFNFGKMTKDIKKDPLEKIRVENLKKIIKNSGKSQLAFCNDAGLRNNNISDMLKGERAFTSKTARNIELKLEIPTGYLDFDNNISNVDFDVTSFKVPEYNVQLSAGRGAEVINPENIKAHHILNDSFLTEYRVKKENLAIVSVVGHSMNPILIDGTKVVIDISRCEPLDNKVFAITTKNHTWVKRCRITPGGTIWQSDNEEYRQYDDDLNNGKSIVVIEGYVLYNLGQKVN